MREVVLYLSGLRDLSLEAGRPVLPQISGGKSGMSSVYILKLVHEIFLYKCAVQDIFAPAPRP